MLAWHCKLYIRPDTELGQVMTVVGELYVLFCIQLKLLISSSEEINDCCAAEECRSRKLAAERRAEQIAALKGLFICAGSWIASPFLTAASFQKHAIQAVLNLTDQFPVCVCLSRSVGGRHLKLLE
jgi:hypothetical protein